MGAKQKIRQYLEFKGVNANQFYRITGLSNGFLDSGEGISSDKMKIIIEHFPDLNLSWVILDDGPMIGSHLRVTRYKNQPSPNYQVNEKDENEPPGQTELLIYVREKDEKIEFLSREIGRLEAQLEQKKSKNAP